ncbi:MAG: DUF2510 domain-containing protein [Acidimicrobiales bacterium]
MSEQSGSWQPDPFGRHQYRYWDGSQWSDQVSNDGVLSTDPPSADPGGAASAEPAGWGAAGTSDPTAAMPTSPSPPPPGGGGPGGPAGPPPEQPGGSGSNTGAIIGGIVILALIIGALVWFLVLSDDDGVDEEVRGEVISSLRSELGISEDQAGCVADELTDSGDIADIADAIERGDDPTDEQLLVIFDALDECDVDPAQGDDSTDTTEDDSTATTEDESTDTTEGADGGSGNMEFPPAMMEMMASEMAAEMGISEDQAECFLTGMLEGFSDEEFEDMLSDPDSFTDPDSMGMAFELFEECDIDPTQLEEGSGGGGGGDASGFQEGDTYGDNPELDALWDACEDGDGDACDELYFTSEVGSEYEEFGDTCGGRFPPGEVLCSMEDLD